MPRWMWEGVFSLDVPNDWEVRDSEEIIELTPPEPVGAGHFSVYNAIDPKSPLPGQAAGAVQRFARERRPLFVAPAEIETTFGRVATASFVEDTEDGKRHWEVGVAVWPERSVLFTYNHDGSHTDLRDAAWRIFSSLLPEIR